MLAIVLVGCAPVLSDDTPYLTDPRVLAVRLEPPEVEPGDEVTVTALAADAGGPLASAALEWSFCVARRPLAELGPVAPECLEPGGDDNVGIGEGLFATGASPADACSLFGPNPPPAEEGQPAGRPADPDVTGGYYQPLVGLSDEVDPTLAAVRLRCGLANVSQELYIEWNSRYLSNTRLNVARLTVDGSEAPIADDGTVAVSAGDEVTLEVAWPEPETYVVYDVATEALVERREAVSVTWFTTGGTFAEARGGRAGDDPETTVENTWTAPADPGEVWLAVVLRDDRGGVDWQSYRLAVE